MKRDRGVVSRSARRVADAADAIVAELARGLVSDEEDFTGRLIGRIAANMEEFNARGLRWEAMTLKHKNSVEERRFGADLLGALDIQTPDYSVRKGFLVQAKRVEPGEAFSSARYEDLRKQCEAMLKLTPASYVFIYSQSGVLVVSALAVVSAAPCNPHELYTRALYTFFAGHFESFFGDRRIEAASREALKLLMDEYHARSGLLLRGGQNDIP